MTISSCSNSNKLLINFRRANVQICCLKRRMINGCYFYVESKIAMLFKLSLLFLRFDAYSFRETVDNFFLLV